MSDSELPKVGPWAREKLGRLDEYLRAYMKILAKQTWAKPVYVDAFAAAGQAEIRTSGPQQPRQLSLAGAADAESQLRDVIDGSPLIALSVQPAFYACVFVERDPARLAALAELKKRFPDRRVRVHEGDCNEYLRDKFAVVDLKRQKYRAVVFLDPFGMHVPWSTIELLAKTRAVEVIINFPVGMAIQRLLPRNHTKLTEATRKKLDDYFGDPAWFDVVYPKNRDMFGGDVVGKADDAADQLVDWYRARLKAAFGFVSPARLIRNSRGGHLYYLVFAGPNANGAKIASHILLRE